MSNIELILSVVGIILLSSNGKELKLSVSGSVIVIVMVILMNSFAISKIFLITSS